MDGYQAYEKTQATLVGCWEHAHRKFIEAKKLQGKNKTGKADIVLSLVQKLYGIESRLKVNQLMRSIRLGKHTIGRYSTNSNSGLKSINQISLATANSLMRLITWQTNGRNSSSTSMMDD